MDPASHAPYLPPEVHQIIARHVDFADLPNYRLANKSCAEIGAGELFSTMTFHCTSASLARIDAVKAHEHLNKHVSTLIWDTNMWSIPDVRDLHEWKDYFEGKAAVTAAKIPIRAVMLAPHQFLDLGRNRQEWERYADRLHDEKLVKDPHKLQGSFMGFQNFYKLHVLNGDLTRTHRSVYKSSDFISYSEAPTTHSRGESLYNDDADALQRPGGWACAALQSFESTSWHLTKLRLDAVYWSVFASAIGETPLLEQLLSLHLRITVQFEPNRVTTNNAYTNQIRDRFLSARDSFSRHHLMDFLARLSRLQSLKLELSRQGCGSGEMLWLAPSSLSDIFSEYHTWPKLRKLSLSDFDTTCGALQSLLERQRSTLKILKMHNIWFEPDSLSLTVSEIAFATRLPEFVERIHKILQLERARWSGWVGRTRDETHAITGSLNIVGWDLDDPRIARSIADCLIKGGVCPLNNSNMLERNITIGHRSDQAWTA
jgi:hypothetical protein